MFEYTLGILSGYDPIHCFINIYYKYNHTIIVSIDDYF